jgi:Xaa-Pro aminopeptidase
MTFNKDALVSARRQRAEKAWGLTDEIVLVGAGKPINKPGHFDQCFEFQTHPQYRWLTESHRPGSVVVFDALHGWTHFVPPLTQLEKVWDGEPEVPEGRPFSEFAAWLDQNNGRNIAALGSPVEGVNSNEIFSALATVQLDHERRKKDDYELAQMRRAASATAAGYQAAHAFIRPGVTERQIQVEIEAAMGRAGAHGLGYHSIVGTGSNSRIFHFTPGDRVVQPDDLVLIDAGAQVDNYVIDVTRTFTAKGKWEGRQDAVRQLVRASEEKVFAMCVKGTRWSDCHRAAAYVLAEGLKDFGLLKASVEDVCESGAIALFLPHGIGHPVGLGVRDSGGAMPGADEEPKVVCGSKVRADLIMEPGFVMTVEPGLYFIPALLNDPEKRELHREMIAFDGLTEWMDFGGLRLEDNLLITEGEPENLTVAIPW